MPTPRALVRWSIIGFALLLLGLVAKEVYWAYTARPGESTEFVDRLKALGLEGQPGPEAGNGWDDLLAAVAAQKRVERGYAESVASLERAPEGWPKGQAWPVDASVLREVEPDAVVARHARAMLAAADAAGVPELLDRVATHRRFVRPLTTPNGRLLDIQLPELSECRALARVCGSRMRVAHAAGDWDALVRAYDHTLALGYALSLQVTLIDRLVGIAIIELANGELRAELTERPPPEAVLARLEAAYDARVDAMPSFARPMEGERLSGLDIIRWTHTDDGKGDGRFLATAAIDLQVMTGGGRPGGGASRLRNLGWILHPPKAESVAAANAMYDEIIAYAAAPVEKRPPGPLNFDQKVQDLDDRGMKVLAMVMPALDSAMKASDRAGSMALGTRVMLAVERYRAAHGSPPTTLTDVGPVGARLDPCNAKRLGYFIPKAGSDPLGRPYLLYSLGVDGTDNDAAEDPQNPAEAYRRNTPGLDFIFNAPRK
jgi:hypothetical protein